MNHAFIRDLWIRGRGLDLTYSPEIETRKVNLTFFTFFFIVIEGS